MKLPASFISYLENKTVLVSGLMLAGLAMLVLLPGTWETTGITGKDEYFLGLRTPLTMIELDKWWVPWLDDAPRLKKPPLIYWLSRASMEIFGASLMSARLVAVLLAALFIYLIYRIGEILVDRRYGLLAAFITLSTLSLAVESRRLMLDLPAAAFSTLALYLLLKWWQRPRLLLMVASAAALSAAVLTKGPLGLAVFGAGALALCLVNRDKRILLFSKYLHSLLFIIVFLALTLPWFIHVYTAFPETSLGMLQDDVHSRKLFTFSLAPVSALLLLLFPWSFVLVWILFKTKTFLALKNDHGKLLLMLLVWLLISLLPFFFFRSFTRYMAGAILPMALICAALPYFVNIQKIKPAAWLAILFAILISLPMMFFIAWFQGAYLVALLGIIALSYFCFTWWSSENQEKMIISSMALWLVLLGLVYPGMGINAMPDKALALVKGEQVILFMGPQPALLAIKSGKAFLRLKDISADLPEKYTMVYTRDEDSNYLEQQLNDAGIKFKDIYAFKTLSSRSTWIKFARKGTKKQDWIDALSARSLAPIQSTIKLYQLNRNQNKTS